MKTIYTKEGKHSVVIFNSSHDLPPRRYQKYNKHVMIAAGVGESLDDYNKRRLKTIGYVKSEDKKSALIELANQQQCVFNALEEYSPSNMAFAVMVYSIDGEVFKSYEENTLNKIIDKLDEVGLTKAMIMEALREIKKKIGDELAMYYETYFRPPVAYNAVRLVQSEALLDSAFFGKDTVKVEEDTEAELLRLTKPKIWNIYIKGNEELKMETGFEKFIFLVQEHTTVDLDSISLFRFYSLLDYIKEKGENNGG